MGDRTTVVLHVPTELIHKIQDVWDSGNDKMEDGDTSSANFYDCNYGNLDCEEEMQKLGVPYDKCWEAGGGYGPGTEYCRFTEEGVLILKSISDDEMGISVDVLLPHLENLEKLKELIQAKASALAVLPWDNQVEYGRRYLARQLIT